MTRPITKLKSIEDSAVKLFARKGIEVNRKETFSTRLKSAAELFYSLFDESPLVFTFILLSESLNGNPYDLVFEFVKEGVKHGEFRIRDSRLGTAMVLGLVLQPAKGGEDSRDPA
jgi:hypothetical protein